MKEYLKLLGWESLLLVLFGMLMLRTQILIPFYQSYFPFTIITFVDFLAFTFGSVFLMAAMNVVCSYYDGKMLDIINGNKTESTEQKNKYKMFWLLAVIGLAIHIFIGIKNNAWQASAISVVFIFGAYFYALKYKREYLIGNILISLLYAIILFLPLFLELFAFKGFESPMPIRIATEGIQDILYIFLYLGAYVFLLTFIRDLTVDLANLEDNKKHELITFPVKEGYKTTKLVLTISSLLFIALNVWFAYKFYYSMDSIHIIFIGIIAILPIIYYIIKLYRSKLQMDYAMLYQILGFLYISLLFIVFFCGDIFRLDAVV